MAAGDELFAGGGELGELMRQRDWSATPLGPVEGWPRALRTCVRIMLTSRQPMFVWWGDELINLYNDAYIAIVGGKHPQALGQPASVVWREIWDAVLPRASGAGTRAGSPMIAIGASTGGTEAIRVVLEQMPPDAPPILITQHIPAAFSGPFAARMDHC